MSKWHERGRLLTTKSTAPNQRWDRAVQSIGVTAVICSAILGLGFAARLWDESRSRLDVYKYCLELGYTPQLCYDTVYNPPKAGVPRASSSSD